MSTLFYAPAGGAAQRVQAGQVLDLTAPVLADGVTAFRRTLYLRIPLDAACDRVTVDAAAALALRFEPCRVSVSRGNVDWVRRWQSASGTVQVDLAYPAPVVRVDSTLYGQVALHRVDGEAVSDDATVSGATGSDLPEPFVATVFEARLSGEKPGQRASEKTRVLAQKQGKHKSLSAAAVGMQEWSETDTAMRNIDQTLELINGLTALHLTGTPGSPRLILRSADGAQVLWQWIEPGPQDAAVDFAAATLAQDWQPALKRALALLDAAADQAGMPRPTAMVLPLEVASDGPCRVHVQQANVTAMLECPLLDAPATLRFTGAAVQVQILTFTPPAGARRVDVLGHYAGDGGATAGGSGAPPVGVRLVSGASAVVPVRLDGPLRCTGVAIGWHPLGADTTLTVRLDAPVQTSRAFAKARIETDRTDSGTLYARWPAVDLQAGACALGLSVDKGCGVLVATPDATAAPIVVTDEAGSRQLALEPDLALLAAPDAAALPVELALSGNALVVTGEPNGSVRALLDPVPPALAELSDWTLRVSSAVPLALQIETARVSYTPA